MDNQYEVVHPFRDLQDKKKSFPNGRVYNVGDSFPATREMDKQLIPERLEELSSNKNKIGKVLIKKVGE